MSRNLDNRDRRLLRARLEPAYLRTRYTVDAVRDLLEEPLELRIGEKHPRVDALGVGAGWVFITAWNPQGQPQPPAENARAHQKLVARLEDLNKRALAGRGVDPNGHWTSEESFLVLDVSRALALRLCEEAEQLAVVFGRPNAAAELLWIDGESTRPRGRCG